jgi:hypothetical protein
VVVVEGGGEREGRCSLKIGEKVRVCSSCISAVARVIIATRLFRFHFPGKRNCYEGYYLFISSFYLGPQAETMQVLFRHSEV